MKGKLSILLLVAVVSAIHIDDDIINNAFSQPGANAAKPKDKQPKQPAQNWGDSNDGWNAAVEHKEEQNWWGHKDDKKADDKPKDDKPKQVKPKHVLPKPKSHPKPHPKPHKKQPKCGPKKPVYQVIKDLSTVPGVDVTIVAGLWSVYNDLFAKCSSIVLVYAANLVNSNGSETWRVIIKITNNANVVTYIAVQLVKKGCKWTTDHQFITHTITDVYFLWNLSIKVKLVEYNLQTSLAACKNPFLQIGQEATKKAVAAANAASEAIIKKLKADIAVLQKKIAALQIKLKHCKLPKPHHPPKKPGWHAANKHKAKGSFVGSSLSPSTASFGGVVSVGNKNFDDTA